MTRAHLLYAAVLLAVVVSPAALGSQRVVGGAPVDIRSAPWSVGILHAVGGATVFCTGAIVDATHVVTAAHCAVDPAGAPAPPSTFLVRAGATNALAASTDRQERQVAAVRVHPGYAANSEGDDVAVLVLAAPLDLGGPAARAIALPQPGLRLGPGQAVSLAGYGVQTVDGAIDGSLDRMTSTIVDRSDCLTAREDVNNAVLLCAFSGTNSPCHGDSGSVLVLETPTPTAVGVTSAATCSANTAAVFGNLAAPEVLQFVQGSDAPPVAPRLSAPPRVDRPTPRLQVGQTVRCDPGEWSGSPGFAYSFLEAATGRTIGPGQSSHVLGLGDDGRRIVCRVAATNDGGTALADSPPTIAVAPPPYLAIRAVRARAGGAATLGVVLAGWVRPILRATVCAQPPGRVGGRVCRTLAVPSTGRPIVELRLPVSRNAPGGRALVRVTVRSSDGRAAAETAVLHVG